MSTQEQLDEYYRGVDASNDAFLAMDRAGRRVQIATDVLTQLRIGRIIPTSSYFWGKKSLTYGMEFRDVLRSEPVCQVCGIGALFIATVDRLNKLKCVGSSWPRSNLIDYLRDVGLFSGDELNATERFFERDLSFNSAWQIVSPASRMTRIAQVIINTEGRSELTLELLLEEQTQ